MNRVIYYYQTFVPLKNIIKYSNKITHIHLSSIHFGLNSDKSCYIHLNDNPPDSKVFNQVWNDLEILSKNGVKIILMIGGAGGAFNVLFSNFEVYYKLLFDTLKKYSFIKGIDLDVEESINVENIKFLINRIDKDFGKDFIISMAPIAYALQYDNPGMGGFIYKKLYNFPEGQRINYFNAQCYGCFDFKTYQSIINNGYPEEKIVMGMISSDFDKTNFRNALNNIVQIKQKYSDFGGVFVWELFDCPPGSPTNPEYWAIYINNAINLKLNFFERFFFNCFGI